MDPVPAVEARTVTARQALGPRSRRRCLLPYRLRMSGALQLHDGRSGGSYGGSMGSSSWRNSDPWGADGGSGQLTLLEEMQRIDIGTGRSERHGSGY